MAVEGGAAGIPGYRVDVSVLVLRSNASIVLLSALALAGRWQQKQSNEIELVSENFSRSYIGKPTTVPCIGVFVATVYALTPLFLMVLSSVRIRDRTSILIAGVWTHGITHSKATLPMHQSLRH